MQDERKIPADAFDDIDAEADDPSLSDANHQLPFQSRTNRTKSKSSSDVLSLGAIKTGLSHQRRHSESSSESLSNERLKKRVLSRQSTTTNAQQRSQSPRTRKSFTQSILSKYKANKSKKKNEDQSLGISGPLNVHHVIHVEWDEKTARFKGIPDLWSSKIPQSVNIVPTQSLPTQFGHSREARSVSLINHQPLPTRCNSSPVDYNMASSDGLPLPGPRVFIQQQNDRERQRTAGLYSDVCAQIPEFHGTIAAHDVMSKLDFLKEIGIADLSQKTTVSEIRREFFLKMGFSRREKMVNLPRTIQQRILSHLDVRSYLRCCCTCSDLASFLDDPIIWRIQCRYKSKVQGTLHSHKLRLRSRVWKSQYMAMVKIDGNPSYHDYCWNIIVIGDTESGQNRLVVSLGRHWRCKLMMAEDHPVTAVNGTYRFGVDFVIRRVVVGHDKVIKLQVWDGGNVMTDSTLLESVNIFLILFDLADSKAFDRTLSIAKDLSQQWNIDAINDNIKLMMVGTTPTPYESSPGRVVSYESAKRFANERGLMYIEANPATFTHAFVDLAEECYKFETERAAARAAAAKKSNPLFNDCLIQ